MIDPSIRAAHDDYGNAVHLISATDQGKLDRGEWFRASHLCTCPVCDRPYGRHSEVFGCLWLTRLCTGELVKF